MTPTDWKARYFELAKLTRELVEHVENSPVYRAKNHLDWSDNLDLQERNKYRLMRLTEDVQLSKEYDQGGYHSEPAKGKLYPKGTLIQCGKNGSVYLDEDGDGHLYFPPTKLEEVEVDRDDPNIDWNNVIWQG